MDLSSAISWFIKSKWSDQFGALSHLAEHLSTTDFRKQLTPSITLLNMRTNVTGWMNANWNSGEGLRTGDSDDIRERKGSDF